MAFSLAEFEEVMLKLAVAFPRDEKDTTVLAGEIDHAPGTFGVMLYVMVSANGL
jgi:hypothetical protein